MRLATFFLLAGAATACGAQSRAYAVRTGPQRPAFGGEVRVLGELEPDPHGFVDDGIVQVIDEGAGASRERALRALQVAAARVGGDTLIRVHADEHDNLVVATGVAGHFDVLAARKTEPAATPAATPFVPANGGLFEWELRQGGPPPPPPPPAKTP